MTKTSKPYLFIRMPHKSTRHKKAPETLLLSDEMNRILLEVFSGNFGSFLMFKFLVRRQDLR
ncbi:hypothetical protein [uncultured Methanobrevibacter sp.]|uniref:hypothetical protein n=1 Tax=uncultured Methanobrevibacter sp. TaxID=253161 RepID=UPI0025FE9786|nr:hypothetical protein [uncultured Methanobrevibacter sp.]